MAEILLLCAAAAGAWAMGRLALLTFMKGGRISGAVSYSLAVGLGCLSFLTLGAGLLGILYPGVLYALTAAACLLVPVSIGRHGIHLSFSALRPMLAGGAHLMLSAVILGIFIVEVLAALGPPMEYDALSYHLLRPLYFLERHRIDFSTSNAFFQFPLLMECLYTLGMGLIGDRLAQLFHLLTMFVALAGLYVFARKKGGETLALLTALLFLCIPMVNYNSPAGLVDLGLAGFEILSFIAIMSWTESGDDRWLLLSGTMTGFALGVKYTGLTACVLNIAVVLYLSRRHKRRLFRSAVLYLLPVIVLPSFWYVKNVVKFSNPLHPFFPSAFSFVGLSPVTEPGYENMQMYHYSFGVGRSLKNLLILPWIITMPHYRIPLESGAMSLIPLALLPGLLLFRKIPGWVTGTLAYCGAYFLLWFFFSTQQGRFITTPMALLCAPTAFSALGLLDKGKLTRWTTLLVILLGVSVSAGVLAYKRGTKALTGAGIISSRTYLENAVGPFAAYQYIHSRLPQAKVLVFFDTRSEYYLGRKYLACESENLPPLCKEDWGGLSLSHVKKRLKNLGATHILINEDNLAFYKGSQWETPAMVKTYTLVENLRRISRKVFSSHGTSLYEVLLLPQSPSR